MTTKFLKHFNLKLPDVVAIFTIATEGIRRQDASALVYDVAFPPGDYRTNYLRHYSFFDRWFAVNVSLDRDGSLLTETSRHGVDFTFNCDIATPMAWTGPEMVARVDLELDLLVRADGRTYHVKDEEDFARSIAAGWITPEEAEHSREGLAELITLASGPGLIAFCESVCPFATADELRVLSLQPPVTFPPLSDAPFFAARRPTVQ